MIDRRLFPFVARSEAFWVELARTQADRFWPKVQRTDNCWLWRGRRVADGYGQFMVTGPWGFRPIQKAMLAHRLSYELEYGWLDRTVLLLHSCDVRECVRTSHLRPGSQADNLLDMRQKGRARYHSGPCANRSGSKNSAAKLTEADVREVRRMLRDTRTTHSAIAACFGVSRNTITRIASGVGWTGPEAA